MSREKKSHDFAITISRYGDREHLARVLHASPTICEWVVARERHAPNPRLHRLFNIDEGDQCPFHLHAFCSLHRDHPQRLVDFRRWLLDSMQVGDNIGLDLKQCKNKRTWIRYITKEDEEPLWRGIDSSLLNIRAQTIELARTQRFDVTHPIVVAHHNQWRIIQNIWNYFYAKFNPDIIKEGIDQSLLKKDVRWLKEFEDKADQTREGQWTFKRKAIYLVGPPDVGKTTAVREYARRHQLRIFQPNSSCNYPFAGIDVNNTDIVLWDDFRWRDEQERLILTFLQGDHCVCDVKFGLPENIKWRGLTVITSNVPPTNYALRARVHEILCDETIIKRD